MARPGIMIYFDMLEPIRVLPDEDKGRLLVAILEYGQTGILPEFDGMLALAWGFVQPKIDRDAEAYSESMLQRQYAAFCKKRKNIWMPKISFDEWVVMSEDERQRAVDPVASRYPSTSTSTSTPSAAASASSPASESSSSATAAAAVTGTTSTADPEEVARALAAAAADRQLKCMNGELGRGVVFLTDGQIEDLLDRLGLDAFDHYVDKLSNFILKNNARVASHYDTILKWWQEDCGLKGR